MVFLSLHAATDTRIAISADLLPAHGTLFATHYFSTSWTISMPAALLVFFLTCSTNSHPNTSSGPGGIRTHVQRSPCRNSLRASPRCRPVPAAWLRGPCPRLLLGASCEAVCCSSRIAPDRRVTSTSTGRRSLYAASLSDSTCFIGKGMTFVFAFVVEGRFNPQTFMRGTHRDPFLRCRT